MEDSLHPAAVAHLPPFITAPGQTDVLFNVMIVFVLLMVFVVGILYLRLHALPEHMAHGASKVQLQIVGVLALIALFTHNHLFWIAALLLAMVEFRTFLLQSNRSPARWQKWPTGTMEPMNPRRVPSRRRCPRAPTKPTQVRRNGCRSR